MAAFAETPASFARLGNNAKRGKELAVHIHRSHRNHFAASRIALCIAVFAGASHMATATRGDIFVADYRTGTVGSYTNSGDPINPALIVGLASPIGIAVSGTDLYVRNGSKISKYTTAGVVVNDALITGLQDPYGIAVSGSELYVSDYLTGTIGKYTTDGNTINAALVSGLSGPISIAVSGSNLFVANFDGNTIGEYTTSGDVVNRTLITSLSNPWGVAVSGTDIYVTEWGQNSVDKFILSTDGYTPYWNRYLSTPAGVAVLGSTLFVTGLGFGSGSGGVFTYPTGLGSGAEPISGLDSPYTIAVTDVPEPASVAILAIGAAALLHHRRSRKA